MPSFSARSIARLQGVHKKLVELALTVVKHFDCTIQEGGGARTLEEQRAKVLAGLSQTLDSKHVVTPERPKAEAMDLAPYPVWWPKWPKLPSGMTAEMRSELDTYVDEVARWHYFGGYVLGTADQLGITLRWGGDWSGTRDPKDNKFDDWGHFELADPL